MNEVMLELSRVTWPTHKETTIGDVRGDHHGLDFWIGPWVCWTTSGPA